MCGVSGYILRSIEFDSRSIMRQLLTDRKETQVRILTSITILESLSSKTETKGYIKEVYQRGERQIFFKDFRW